MMRMRMRVRMMVVTFANIIMKMVVAVIKTMALMQTILVTLMDNDHTDDDI